MTLTPERWHEAKAVVAAALERPVTERAALVAARCGTDPTLRAEVESLLAAAAQAPESLAVPEAVRAAALAAGRGVAPRPDDDGAEAITADLAAALASRYVVEGELGRGGTATVYRARDLRHRRAVAVKVLHSELAAVIGTERFLQEIALTASLQHPHVLPLFDSGEAAGVLYYVMPYVAGASLRGRLKREGPLPVADALRIAREIAAALEYAHRRGVVHRDIKPENILLAEDGSALVADFGIALAAAGAAGDRLTHTGISLGTPSYMSPEQAAGDRDLDQRTDIWALGCVLYEMLAGHAPFAAPSAAALMARVLTADPPPLRAARPDVPARVDAAVRTALEKRPADRFATAAAFEAALAGGDANVLRPHRRPRVRARPLVWAVGATALAAAAITARPLLRPAPARPGLTRFTLPVPPGERLTYVLRRGVAIAPDGRTVAFVATDSAGTERLHVRRLDDERPRVLPGTERVEEPFFSPDGEWIAYFGPQGELFKQPAGGGSPVPLLAHAHREGASWGPNGVIVLGMSQQLDGTLIPGLAVVSADGGTPRPLTTPDAARGESRHSYPVVLDDGETVLFESVPRDAAEGLAGGAIGVASLSTGAHTVLPLPGRYPVGVADGRLLYAGTDGALMAVRFDVPHRRVTGTPVRVDEGPKVEGTGDSFAALAASGTLVYARRVAASRAVLVDERAGARGLPVPLVGLGEREFFSPRFAPDGRRIALSIGRVVPTSTVWVYDTASHALSRLAPSHERVWDPVWTPDGQRVVFASLELGIEQRGIWIQPADGSAPPELLVMEHGGMLQGGAVSPDGGTLLYAHAPHATDHDLRTVALTRGATPRTWLGTSANEIMPEFSPDGQWVAYVSDETGRNEVYVRRFDGGARVQVSTDGGAEPCWAPDGRQLFYRSGRRMLAAGITTAPALAVAGREVLFEGDYVVGGRSRNYDVAPDGRHFLLLQPANEGPQLVVVVDWLEQVRARLRTAP